MRVTVIPNDHGVNAAALTEAVCDVLRRGGADVTTEIRAGGLPSAARIAQVVSDSDVAVAIGGDGTIVHVAKAAAVAGCPVLGINGGHLGFLAGLERNELDALPTLLKGEFAVEERMLLQVTVRRGDGAHVYTAMNEAVVSRGALSQLVDVRVSDHSRDILACRGDGVIVATPTGSTAYSLSAGGPVVDPAVECVLVTPICPHTVAPHAHILPSALTLTVAASTLDGADAFLTVDGEENIALSAGDEIAVCRAAATARLVRLKESTFYDILEQKMLGRRKL